MSCKDKMIIWQKHFPNPMSNMVYITEMVFIKENNHEIFALFHSNIYNKMGTETGKKSLFHVPRRTYPNAAQKSGCQLLGRTLFGTFFTKTPFRFYSENRERHKSLPPPLLIPSRLWSLSPETSTPGAMGAIIVHHTDRGMFHLQWLSYWRWKLHECAHTHLCNHSHTHTCMCVHTHILNYHSIIPSRVPSPKLNTLLFS